MPNSIIVILQAKVCRNFLMCFHLVIAIGDLGESSPLCQIDCLLWSYKILYVGSMTFLFYLVDCVGFVPVFHGTHNLDVYAGVQKVLCHVLETTEPL